MVSAWCLGVRRQAPTNSTPTVILSTSFIATQVEPVSAVCKPPGEILRVAQEPCTTQVVGFGVPGTPFLGVLG